MSGYSPMPLMLEPTSQLISVGGVELTDSRKVLDLYDIQAARCQFKASAGMSVRVEYSLDDGSTWATLVSEDGFFGENPCVNDWTPIPDDAKANNVLVRGLGIGIGLLTTVNFVFVEFR